MPVARRLGPGEALFRALGEEVDLPTRGADTHAYWIVPVLVRNREGLRACLRRHGFDTMSERLSVVTEGAAEAPGARRLSQALYLPFDPGMSEGDLKRLGTLVTREVARERLESLEESTIESDA